MDQLINAILTFLGANPATSGTYMKVVAILTVVYLVVTGLRNVGLIIVHITKDARDDIWLNKWIVKPIDLIMPYMQLLPHTTIPAGKIWKNIVFIFTWVKKLFPDRA